MSNIFVVDADSFEGVEEQLKSAKATMLKSLNSAGTRQPDIADREGVMTAVKKDPTSFAVIINGYSLVKTSASYIVSTLCLKVSTFKLSVTLSNLNRFRKCLHCWKAYEICYKTHTTSLTSP